MRRVFVTKRTKQVVLVASESYPRVAEVDLEEEIGDDEDNQRDQQEHNATSDATRNPTCRCSRPARSFRCMWRRSLRSRAR